MTRPPSSSSSSRTAPSCTPTATGCSRSVQDAEDALQEALLGAWRGLPRFEGRSSLRSWLYKVATNACLKLVERRPKLVLPVDYGPAADPHDGLGEPVLEPLWVEPYPDAGLAYEQRESVELAFIAALQHLPARQRAVLILSEVLGFSGAEVAEALETTPASVYSALQRAHKTVDERLPRQSQQATLRALGDARLRVLVGELRRRLGAQRRRRGRRAADRRRHARDAAAAGVVLGHRRGQHLPAA